MLSPRDIVEGDLGVGLVFPDDPGARRLDLWLADTPDGLALRTQVDVLRQLAEALDYLVSVWTPPAQAVAWVRRGRPGGNTGRQDRGGPAGAPRSRR